ncbi:hypothetical protein ACWT_0605 [Actinoplanes sp. SE50]|uniref:DUF3152 domain-containing protein n=1 Tax=unclassified Actinoplanes TaxID=2626549 RepID=UPI00023ECFBF|nr:MULTISPECIES: DUF3152 domain-containing protein [unclassified Actinoplanes]AEV81619.1 hypothetical protein ACPL_722 [Actinoplanes sp. SE50/110]ATO80020.1 hypothetical protein ACWT_0605 [Actinoplanes sp. SE50]SLL97424.1 hypothetical protein ACSP50_0627 [Actinoplanes sp. SE50/110]
MVPSGTPTLEPPARATDRWRQWWPALFAITLVLLVVITVAVRHSGRPTPSAAATPSPAASPSAAPTSAAPTLEHTSAPPSAGPTSLDPEILQVPGAVPTHGSGDFVYAVKRGAVLGGKGPIRRFHVAVEKGSGEDANAFATLVVSTLGDARSWVGDGNLRLQMVDADDHADFTVYLATRETAGEMCQRGGTNIHIGGVPYTSCRVPGAAIINLDRYRKSAKPYLAAKIPLATYRMYVINHEVGHELGHHHEGCPEPGGPAPVMVQQTLMLRGCVPYSWPRLDNHPFTGPSVSH